MARHKAPPGATLLKRLQGMEGKPPRGLSLIMISLSALPTDNEDDDFWGELDDFLVDYKNRYDADLYELSLADRAVLIKMSEQGEVGMISDLKVSVLRLIQQFFPENFGMVDQTRLLRAIDLGFKLPNAIKFLEHYESQPGKTGEKGAGLRGLQEDDIKMVLEVKRKVGAQSFKEIFVQNQSHAMHPPPLFAHGQHSVLRILRRRKMDVAELGQRIAHGIVDGALADIATFYMRNRNTQR